MAEDETVIEGDDEDAPLPSQNEKDATRKRSSTEPEKQGILSQALVDRWCTDAKEKKSMAAFDRLMKVGGWLLTRICPRTSK